ncbi:hypothetical protein [Clostridium algidicarnis]|uniref:hypothetical protein n=1 Tax=Clostridium algidicarnis TaxID=37659 RepID=UPI003FD89CD6
MNDFLYEAIFIIEGVQASPKSVINLPELQVYVLDFEKKKRIFVFWQKVMKKMLYELQQRGSEKTSLAVQKVNYAVKMYKNVGFEIVDENEEEYIMVCHLKN